MSPSRHEECESALSSEHPTSADVSPLRSGTPGLRPDSTPIRSHVGSSSDAQAHPAPLVGRCDQSSCSRRPTSHDPAVPAVLPPLDRFRGEGAAVTIMVDTQRALTGGVDTHADVHVAAVIDPGGGLLGVKSFATDLAGYKLLSDWMGTFGEIGLVGVE